MTSRHSWQLSRGIVGTSGLCIGAGASEPVDIWRRIQDRFGCVVVDADELLAAGPPATLGYKVCGKGPVREAMSRVVDATPLADRGGRAVEGLIGGTQGAADGIRNGWHEGSQSIADGRPWPGLRAFSAEFR